MPRLNSKCQFGASKRKQRKQWEAMQASLQGSMSKYLKRTSDCGISASSMPTSSTGNTATQDESAGAGMWVKRGIPQKFYAENSSTVNARRRKILSTGVSFML